jgi:hypothetical protein
MEVALKADTQSHAAAEPPKQAPKEPAPASSRVPSIFVALVVVAVAGLSIFYLLRGQPLLVQGGGGRNAVRHRSASRWACRRNSRRARPECCGRRPHSSCPKVRCGSHQPLACFPDTISLDANPRFVAKDPHPAAARRH